MAEVFGVLGGVALLVLVQAYWIGRELNQLRDSLNARLDRIETRLDRIEAELRTHQ
jgi:hypothetical protein